MSDMGSSLSTIRELVELIAGRPAAVAVVLLGIPAAILVLGLMHGKGRGGAAPWRHLYAVLVYLVCVPGMFSAVLTGYTLFFTNENLLDVNFLVYILPIISMAVTLLLMRRQVNFDDVPGFGRLTGLMAMIGSAFVIVFALSRTRLWLVFGGSIAAFFALAAFAFGLMKWGAAAAFRRRDEPKEGPPSRPF